MTRKELKFRAKQQLKGNWWTAIGVILIIAIIEGLLGFLGTKYEESVWYPTIIGIVTFLIVTPLVLGKTIFFLKLSKSEEGRCSDVFLGYKNYLKVIGVSILSEIIICIGFIVFIIPGIILSLMYSQVYYILAENPDIGIVECLKKSRVMMQGQKWNYFVLMLSFILWGILTAITAGIAGLYVIPYYEATFTNFYLDINDKKELA
ncbi:MULTISPECIES: DUF975 family protein [unclassified Romboutsia]|uniref:DUF975 family protein n=1 Tax=unclassified Romboutsia TaxID=2626894 RepID=UPI00082047CF|nr:MULTISPECIES: DUF975 family protein [unclassified Romboutsia]SCI01684.1 Predicted membrane protein [uncultured Clostridium sp.]